MQKQILKGMIGLEIHCYIVTKEKLFCRCRASREKGLQANIFICPICTGMPGAKPMLPNGEAVRQAVRIGLMLGCKINQTLAWMRKHYDWPDLPKGYQNTISGTHAIPLGVQGEFQGIRIRSMHLEEDPASWEPETGKVDYNRSGLPLVEIITEPDFANAEEVMTWLKELVHALSYLKTADSNAGIKVDVNVNIPGKTERVEIKNINSLESIGKAIEYELERQGKEGGKSKETRRYNEVSGRTDIMRVKEEAEDYRFIRDPDLQNLSFDAEFIKKQKDSLPELPQEKLARLVKKYKIEKYYADILTKNIDIAEFFEKVIEKVGTEVAVPWVTVELLRFLNYNKTKLDKVDIKAEHFIALLDLIREGKITPLKAKEILNSWHPKSSMPSLAEGKISDELQLKKYAEQAIKENEKAVQDYKAGEKKAFEFLMGAIMRLSNKRADYALARKVLEKMLKH